MQYQVKRQVIRTEYGTIDADSYQQVVDQLRANLFGDVVVPVRDHERVSYEINGVPLLFIRE